MHLDKIYCEEKNKRAKWYGWNKRNRWWIRKDVHMQSHEAFDMTLLDALDITRVQLHFLLVFFLQLVLVLVMSSSVIYYSTTIHFTSFGMLIALYGIVHQNLKCSPYWYLFAFPMVTKYVKTHLTVFHRSPSKIKSTKISWS